MDTVIQVIIGFLLLGAGAILLQLLVYRGWRTLSFHLAVREPKLWTGLACLIAGALIMAAPILL